MTPLAYQLARQQRQLNALRAEVYLLAERVGRVEAAVGREDRADKPSDGEDSAGSGGSVVDGDDRDAGRREQPVGGPIVADDLVTAVVRIIEALREGRDIFVVTEPDLVSAVHQLLSHGPSHSSVDSTAPEPTDGAGSTGPVPSVRSIGDLLQELREACGGDCIVTVTYGGRTR